MGRLEQAKIIGGIGSILELVPGVAIVGYILALIAVKYVSDELNDRAIFNNMLYAVITGIIGVGAGVFLIFTGTIFSVFTAGLSALVGGLLFLAIAWIVLIISAIFIRRSFEEMATRLGVGGFRTAGTLYLVGALTTIILVGFIILLVAYIFQIIAFFSIKEVATSPLAPQPVQPVQQAQPAKFCTRCGAPLGADAAFCDRCGQQVQG